MTTVTKPEGTKPGEIRFGADDLERIELLYWFRGVGSVRVGLSFDEAEAQAKGAEIDRDLRQWFFDLIRDAVGEKTKVTMEIIDEPAPAKDAAA